MSKRFVFNKEDLKFTEKKVSFTGALWTVVKYAFFSLLTAAVFYIVFFLVFDTKQDKMIKSENDYLVKMISDMDEKSDLIDDVIKNLKSKDRDIYRDIFNADPPASFSGDDSDSTYNPEYIKKHTGNELIMDVYRRVLDAEIEASCVENSISVINNVLKDSSEVIMKIPCIIPLKNFSIAQTGASSGMKINPFYKTILMHEGLDMMAPIGTDVLAAADGVVTMVFRDKNGKGNSVTIEHAGGIRTVYAHLGDIYVWIGSRVKQRAVIARTGNSGTVFAPSLHYEVIRNGKPQNPIDYFFADISPAVYREMMMISRNTGQSMD